jgi:hypothetical protein
VWLFEQYMDMSEPAVTGQRSLLEKPLRVEAGTLSSARITSRRAASYIELLIGLQAQYARAAENSRVKALEFEFDELREQILARATPSPGKRKSTP